MRLTYLSLTNFRNYTRLELRLPERITVFQGANAQGKTNLLEAIHLLATGRSPRASAERELINWLALESPLPYARLEAEVGEGRHAQKLEMVLELAANGGRNGPRVRKQVRINGTPKRALDLVGRLRVVLFLPEDVNLVAGSPALRRRYLDIALCQIAPTYCRALSQYNRAIAQRNALLKQLREHGGDAGQLDFWDARIAEHGSVVAYRRHVAVQALDRIAAERHMSLTQGQEQLGLRYLPSPEALATANGEGTTTVFGDRETVRRAFEVQLRQARGRDLAAGTSLIGPHRDDMAFTVDERDLRRFGSRGQQRTAALALKLAEVQLMQDETGESPLLLLDDVMSELDATRRGMLLEGLTGVAQALVTTTDWEDFTPDLLAQSHLFQVTAGRLLPLEAPQRTTERPWPSESRITTQD